MSFGSREPSAPKPRYFHYNLNLTFCIEEYVQNLNTENIPKIEDREPTTKEAMKEYFRNNMILSAKYGNKILLQYFWNILKSNEKETGMTKSDIYDIIHNKDRNDVLGTSCLNYANQNKDEETALLILIYENSVHSQDKFSVLKCIRESLNNGELKTWIKEQNEEKGDPKFAAIGSIFLQIVILSILPYCMDEVSDIGLYLTYRSKSAENQTDQESLLSNLSYTREYNVYYEYNIAKQITGLILLINGIVYVVGIFVSNPTWIKKYITENERKQDRIKTFENMKKRDGSLLELYQEELDTLLKERVSKPLNIFLVFSSVIARIFWPLFILIPHSYINILSQIRSNTGNDKYHTENLWVTLKIVESSIENVTQLFLQIWLLLPYFKMISMWRLHELKSSVWNGSKHIMTFGYDQQTELDTAIGKIFVTIILLSLTHAMQRVKKSGNGIGSTMKLLVIMFPATLLQVTARMYMVRNLMLINASGTVKYSLFFFVHFIPLLIMKLSFETRRKLKTTKRSKQYTLGTIQPSFEGSRAFLRFPILQEALDSTIKKSISILNGMIKAKTSFIYKTKRPILLLASCLSSTIVMVDLHWFSSRLHYPKFNFITTSLFHLLIFMENLAMTILPFVDPSLFPSPSDFNHDSFIQAVWIVNISWIVAVLLEVIK